MSLFLATILPKVSRVTLIFGLLSCLLFSYGEGLRLLPFPPEKSLPQAAERPDGTADVKYQKNILRISGERKARGEMPKAHTDAKAGSTGNSFAFTAAVCHHITCGGAEDLSEHRRIEEHFPSIVKGRAPPVSLSDDITAAGERISSRLDP